MLKVASKVKELNGTTEADLIKMGFKKLSKDFEADFCERFGIDEGTTDIYAYRNKWDFESAYGVKKGAKDLTVIL